MYYRATVGWLSVYLLSVVWLYLVGCLYSVCLSDVSLLFVCCQSVICLFDKSYQLYVCLLSVYCISVCFQFAVCLSDVCLSDIHCMSTYVGCLSVANLSALCLPGVLNVFVLYGCLSTFLRALLGVRIFWPSVCVLYGVCLVTDYVQSAICLHYVCFFCAVALSDFLSRLSVCLLSVACLSNCNYTLKIR